MSHSSREDLLGYLLGALERADHERVEHELSQNPQLLDQMTKLKRNLDSLGLIDEPEHFTPPVALAERTRRLVAGKQMPLIVPARHGLSAAMTSGAYDRSSYTWSDFIAMAAVVVAAAALFFPALSSSRFQSQVALCQNHLRQLGMAFQDYSTLQSDHSYPRIEMVGNRNVAGVIGPLLHDAGFVSDPHTFLCPSSELARNAQHWHMPSLPVLDAATGPTLIEYQRSMGGSYGYNMGFQHEGRLQASHDQRRTNYAMVSDAPSDETRCRRSVNHGRRGQNVLFEDGHVTFVNGSCATLPDDPFHNLNGQVAAGLHESDAVLGESSAVPLPILTH